MKILVGISGGVDSACAALKLMREGHDVEGAILKMHEYSDIDGAVSVAEALKLPLHVIDVSKSFNNIIKENFMDEYLAGRTPNPCILCNERVKFRELYDFAMKNGFDRIATGHYARIAEGNGRFSVACASEGGKDQSYMLYRLPQEILSKLLLPLSDAEKSEVRALAAEAGIPVADKKDSQEICFLPNGGHAEFIEEHRGVCPKGDFISPDGKLLGRHNGIIRYTVGQRKGLGIALGERIFVTDINPTDNTVTLSPAMIGREEVTVESLVFSGIEPQKSGTELCLSVRLRYSAPRIPTCVTMLSDGTARLKFDAPVTASPGQSAVLYDGEKVVFGGFICR